MKRAIGFNLGMRGDIIMNTVVARAFKQQCPDYHLTLGVGPSYADMKSLFDNHPYIDDFHVYNSYDGWPNDKDRQFLLARNFDTVFNGMPQHTHSEWWRYVHQAREVCWMHGMEQPRDGMHCQLTRWFDVESNPKTIAFAPFAGWYNQQNDKKLTIEQAQKITGLLAGCGYRVLQIGGPGEPHLAGTDFPQMSYSESIRAILGCRLFIHTDTGAGWAISAYQHPQLGLYSHRYYGREFVGNIQPVNPNSLYLSEENVNQITLDKVAQAVQDMMT